MNKLDEMRKLSDKRRKELSSERTEDLPDKPREGLPEKIREDLLKEGFLDVSDIEYGECKGFYDTRDFVSPYSKTACNLNADVMLIGQDWSSQDTLKSYQKEKANEVAKTGYDANIPTNKNLQNLLKEKLKLNFSDCYATNLFVFIKPKKISSPIKKKYFIECAKEYTLPEIAIVKPKIVICLGSQVFKVLSKVITGTEANFLTCFDNHIIDKNSDAHIIDENSGAYLLGSYHPGGLGTKAAGGKENVKKHWEKIGEFYRSTAPIARV
jgi:restriction system protein